eukprot:8866499-Pyramimonas_sp.AAC.1
MAGAILDDIILSPFRPVDCRSAGSSDYEAVSSEGWSGACGLGRGEGWSEGSSHVLGHGVAEKLARRVGYVPTDAEGV